MNLFGMLDVSASAMTAERQRAEVVASNMANAETTRTPEGGPYQRKLVVFRSGRTSRFPRLLNALYHPNSQKAGVKVSSVVPDPAPPQMRYDPSHPDANPQGYVAYPNVEPVREMVDLLGAVRAYEINSSAVQAVKQMIQQSLEIVK
ncbi:MAG TPA: flagellar basal body rod protein FlgC [Terriglobales bacterium]|nr:flagellar basal body rod protein FlgC [Terriglobales bacterium]